MKQSLETLEVSVLQLVSQFEALVNDNKRLSDGVSRLKTDQQLQKQEHQAAVDELTEALLVQVNKLKEDLQTKIDQLTAENNQYRQLLSQNATQLRHLLERLPKNNHARTEESVNGY